LPRLQVQIPEIEIVDIDSIYNQIDEAIEIATTETDSDIYEEDELVESEEEDEEKEEMRLEAALAAVDNSEMFATAFAQAQILASMNMAIQMNSYYAANIQGGVYNDSLTLVDKKIEDNKQGLRNGFAQQLLHEQMIQEQYK
jgi:tetrahydromethanopterin S-methyltransferase subunit A